MDAMCHNHGTNLTQTAVSSEYTTKYSSKNGIPYLCVHEIYLEPYLQWVETNSQITNTEKQNILQITLPGRLVPKLRW